MTASQVVEARRKEKQKEKELQIGKFSEALINMAEYLTVNNHIRNEVYNIYSIKQIFFYFDKIVKINNQRIITESTSRLVSNIAATTGKIDAFKKFMNGLEK